MKRYSHLLAALLVAAGCASDFTAYNEVVDFRVLGLRASTPELAPGDETLLDALVTSTEATYLWSWCPIPSGNSETGDCPISETDFRDLVAAAGASEQPPPFALGSEPTVAFRHSIPPELLAGICENIGQVELPEGVVPPACDGRFEVSVRAEISGADKTIISTRSLSLLYADGLVPNANPTIGSGQISVRGAPPFELSGSAPTTVTRDVNYTLELMIDEAQSQQYPVQAPDGTVSDETETLFVTWFYEYGAMDKLRTSFNAGITDFENLRTNEYRTPTTEELAQDSAQLYFVIRDNRGGLDWFAAQLELVE